MIAYIQDNGQIAFSPILLSVPELTETEFATQIEPTELPQDEWHEAYKIVGNEVVSDVPLLKLWAHGRRRIKRDLDMADLDKEVMIVGVLDAAGNPTAPEVLRAGKRNANATLQTAIDACTTETELKELIINEEL